MDLQQQYSPSDSVCWHALIHPQRHCLWSVYPNTNLPYDHHDWHSTATAHDLILNPASLITRSHIRVHAGNCIDVAAEPTRSGTDWSGGCKGNPCLLGSLDLLDICSELGI